MKASKIHVAIPGCSGRMGRALIQAISMSEDMVLAGASEIQGVPVIGQDAGLLAGVGFLQVPIVDTLEKLLENATGIIDFTSPKSTLSFVEACQTRQLPMVIGTTGLDEAQHKFLLAASHSIPIVHAPNMSVGVNVLLHLVEQAANRLGPSYDFEIVEAHHRHKRDAPSGTALKIAQVYASATQTEGTLDTRACYHRQGDTGPRPKNQIGLQTIRAGDIIGEHTVMFCTEGERIELVHRASSRLTFATGAVRALRWAIDKPPGLYTMQNVLGFASER